MFSCSKAAELPPYLYNANIALILKLIHHIVVSLPQMETKILCKWGSLIQYVLIKLASFQGNIFQTMNQKQKEECAVIELDLKYLKNYIEWKYMLTTLKHFGFGPDFIKWGDRLFQESWKSLLEKWAADCENPPWWCCFLWNVFLKIWRRIIGPNVFLYNLNKSFNTYNEKRGVSDRIKLVCNTIHKHLLSMDLQSR